MLQQELNLAEEQANKLARFLIEPKSKGKLEQKEYTLSKDDIQSRIESLVGKYRKYGKQDIQMLIENFFSPQNECYRSRFLNEMNDLIHVERVSLNEFEQTVAKINIDINLKTLLIFLMRQSNSINLISSQAINSFLETVYQEESRFKTSNDDAFINREDSDK